MEKENTESMSVFDKIHTEDLNYMMEHTYVDVGFFLHALTQDSTTYTYWGDLQKNLFFISDNMRDKFGFERNMVPDLLKEWMKHIHNPLDKSRYVNDMHEIFQGKRDSHDMRYQVVDRDGNITWIRCSGMVKRSEDGTTPLFFCGKVTQQDSSLQTDPVSDFAGEPILVNHLKALEKVKRGSTCVGFQLNNISKINSALGRNCGKQLIHNIACDLKMKCPARMPFYRLDHTRFIGVLSDTAEEKFQDMVELIRSIVTDNYKRMDIAMHDPCSFAVMHFPRENLSVNAFLQNLTAMIDLASLEMDIPYLDENSDAVSEKQQQDNIELLLNKNVLEDMEDFRVVIQPVVSSNTGEIVGGETLLRWQNENIDIPPGIFIPILEKSGLIQAAGRWVFEQAVKNCKMITQYLPDFYLSVNVSLKQLFDPLFLKFIPGILSKYQLDGSHIVVEMTESCMDQEPERVLELIQVCQSCGIRIALDDFGSGYSSMQVLLKYPLSIVKIDRSLLLEMTESKKKYNFLSSIVYACHQFGMEVCIEGVETEKQRGLSWYTGCDLIQGFYYYRPTEMDKLVEIIKTIQKHS